MDFVKLNELNEEIKKSSNEMYSLIDNADIFNKSGKKVLAKICEDRATTLLSRINVMNREFDQLINKK